ncbi:hypothetical protein PP175_23545 [Aneurinibacillus sp. Ricciae_BoGa-3]|uniref:hypothetical protein n=1 Tax=Aneurinibacillus sp. Ricciae_BoGa-3 TaxID=3022697 RepID=UPI002340D3A9|nr:hypothetical protein [Aneurinibacillus sp. Ricciae_BoGa-3]WCK54227.1 hypothetical protein PP175_23545 [Aneurinibacillus sp. Ricciae_BoGa-3]
MQFRNVEQLAREFWDTGHYYCPVQTDVGEVTQVALGSSIYGARCSASRFLFEIAKARWLSLDLLRKQSRSWLQHRKHVPVIMEENLVILQFPFGTSYSKAHRNAGVRLSSIKNYHMQLLHSCQLVLADSHSLVIPCKEPIIRRQLTWGEHILSYYKNNRFSASASSLHHVR